MPLILGTNSIKDTGYDVANSARWNRADSAYMDRTFSSAGNRDKWTYSLWVKKCKNGVEQRLLTTSDNASFDDTIRFNSDDTFTIICNNAVVLKTNRVFRDNSAFYHICVIWDSGNGTSGDRCKLFVNGTRETSFSTESYPSQNQDSFINNNTRHYIGVTNVTANSHFFDGYLTEIVFQNDSADSPVDKFGEFDSDTPTIFKPIDVSGLTFGTNGFYLDFEDSSALGNDVSGNNNDFSLTNFAATDQSTDTCTNNFCTVNPLDDFYAGGSLSEGNLKYVTGSGNPSWNYITSTFGVNTGKWYWEVKDTTNNSSIFGFASKVSTATNDQLGESAGQWGVQKNGSFRSGGSNLAANGTFTFTQNQIVGVALDATNNKVYFHVNGTYGNSGNPSTGANGITITAPTDIGFYFPAFGDGDTTADTYEINFGSPINTISSGNADGNGFGNFEYAVPTGFFSLCTKNIGESG